MCQNWSNWHFIFHFWQLSSEAQRFVLLSFVVIWRGTALSNEMDMFIYGVSDIDILQLTHLILIEM